MSIYGEAAPCSADHLQRSTLPNPSRQDKTTKTTEDMLQQWNDKLKEAHQVYSEAIKRYAEDVNLDRRQPDFKIGDQVMLKTKFLNWPGVDLLGKHLKPANAGPFKVIDMTKSNVTLDWGKKGVKIHPVQPINRVFKYIEDTSPYRTKFQTRLPAPIPTDEGEEFEIEEIKKRRYVSARKRYEYLVHWKGYSPFYDQWISADELSRNASRIKKQYDDQFPIPRG